MFKKLFAQINFFKSKKVKDPRAEQIRKGLKINERKDPSASIDSILDDHEEGKELVRDIRSLRALIPKIDNLKEDIPIGETGNMVLACSKKAELRLLFTKKRGKFQ
jgi:hypothetical protein